VPSLRNVVDTRAHELTNSEDETFDFPRVKESTIQQELPVQPGGSLRSRVFRAGSWALLGHFLSLALRLAGSLILTRIFAPGVFGILAVVFAVQVLISLLTDIGIRQAVIQSRNGGDPSVLNTAWTLQI
jgi:hypothetical protein